MSPSNASLPHTSLCAVQVTSFHAKATEVGSEIDYDHRVTEWLERSLPLPAVCEDWPKVVAYRMYVIQHRTVLRERLKHVTLALAVALNVLLTAFHNGLTEGGGLEWGEQFIISGLSGDMLLLTTANFAVKLYLQTFTFMQQGLVVRCCLVFVQP